MPLYLKYDHQITECNHLAIHKAKKTETVILKDLDDIMTYYTSTTYKERDSETCFSFTSSVKFLDINKLANMLLMYRLVINANEYLYYKQKSIEFMVLNRLMPGWEDCEADDRLDMIIKFFYRLMPTVSQKVLTDKAKGLISNHTWIIEELMKDKYNRHSETFDYLEDLIDEKFGIDKIERKMNNFIHRQSDREKTRKERQIALLIHTINTACFNPHCELGVKMFNFRLKVDGLDEYYGE